MSRSRASRHHADNASVLLDVTPMAGARPTGIGNYTRHLLHALLDIEGIDVAGSWRPGGSRRWSNLKPLVPKGMLVRPWLPLLTGLNLHRFDLYHGTDGRIPERSRFRTVVTVHDMAVYENGLLEESFARQGRERTEAMLKSRPDRILVISEFTGRRLVEIFPEVAPIVRVVPLGVQYDARPIAPERIGRNLPATIDGPFLLSPGTVERRKNQIGAIRAFEIIHRSFPDIRLVIAGGNGFDSDAAQHAIESSPARESITRLGYVGDEELAVLYAEAIATIYPSLYEGFGLPILEAMAAGSPVVTSNRGAMRETAGDAALLVDPGSPESIAEGVIRLLGDEALRQDLVRAGRARAMHFSWRRCAEGTAAVYREMAGKGAGSQEPE